MAKRKALTKKTRFEVFKRDGFICAYCGQTPPSVVLEIDHIEPVSKGGDNAIENLITSCFDCNRGKRDIPLDKIPPKISENLEVLKEKEPQLKQYRKFCDSIRRRQMRDVRKIQEYFTEEYDRLFTENFKKTSVLRFLQMLPFHEVEDAIICAIVKKYDPDRCIKYFCGICWRKIKGEARW